MFHIILRSSFVALSKKFFQERKREGEIRHWIFLVSFLSPRHSSMVERVLTSIRAASIWVSNAMVETTPSACEADSRSGHAGQSPRSLTPTRERGRQRKTSLTHRLYKAGLCPTSTYRKQRFRTSLKNLPDDFEVSINKTHNSIKHVVFICSDYISSAFHIFFKIFRFVTDIYYRFASNQNMNIMTVKINM